MIDPDAWPTPSRVRFVRLHTMASPASKSTILLSSDVMIETWRRTVIGNESQHVRDRLLALKHLLLRQNRAFEHWQSNIFRHTPTVSVLLAH